MPIDILTFQVLPSSMARVASRRRTSSILLLPAMMLVAASCGSTSTGNEGDCSGFVKFDETIYRLHNLTVAHVSKATLAGDGEVLGCDKEAIDTVDVYRINGVDTRIAIAVPDSPTSKKYLVWVTDGSKPSQWPDRIRKTSEENPK